jgi:hypothetical protein
MTPEENIRIRELVANSKKHPHLLSLDEHFELIKNYHKGACWGCKGIKGLKHAMFGDNIIDCKWCNSTGFMDYWKGSQL